MGETKLALVVYLVGTSVQLARPLSAIVRGFRHLTQLVMAVALLHFRQRERTPEGAIIADVNDYLIALTLAADPLAASRGEIGEATRRFLLKLRDVFGDREFDSNEAQSVSKLKRSTARGRLPSLAEARLIEQTGRHEGSKPARWKITGNEPNSVVSGLPTAAELRGWMAARKPAPASG